MYPVSANFHTLAIQDAPKTRIRIYFIGDGVDCTDDNDVQTNGTLLKWAAGDTDSNGRIAQDGVSFNEFYNPDKDLTIGTAVSSQIGMTLLNTDGALNGFAFGRCKVYLDVYDPSAANWLPCPMGVYNIELPTKRKVQLVSVSGYDQMQKFEQIADTWWNGLNWSAGLTLLQIVQSMAAQVGVSVSSNTASAIVNSGLTYTEAPFDCIEVTYREVLEYIAEATGTVARFDRNGALDLRWFAAAQISGNIVTVNTDTVGNQCLAISVAEYSVVAVDLLKVKLYTDDIGTTVGTGTNQYTIVNNLFLDGANSSAIIAKATPIYNRLHGLGAYSPVSARIITDWSIEAGDIINIVNGGTTYSVPIFQQGMAWHGGYVVSDLLSDGDNVRPVLDYDERTYYRLNSEMSKKVGDNEIISKINQSPESITIQANKVNLTGYVTFTNLSTDGQTSISGGNITTGTIDANVVNVSNINADNITTGTLKAITIQDTGTTPSNYWDLSGGNFVATNGSVGGFALSSSGLSYGSIRPEGSGTGFALRNNSISYVTEDELLSKRDITSITGLGLGFGDNTNATPGVWNWKTGLNHGNIYVNGAYRDRFSIDRLKPPDYTASSAIVDFTDNGTNFYTIFNGDVKTSGDTTVGGDLDVSGDASVVGNMVTVGGVLDVTPRRAYASLSSAGWYRILKYSGDNQHAPLGTPSFIVRFGITRHASTVNGEVHEITMTVAYNGSVKFSNEISNSNALIIDKIRYTYSGNNAYVDIHYNESGTNIVVVDFDVDARQYIKQEIVSQPFTSVVPSPSGETVMTEYTFSKNTDIATTTFTPTSGSSYATYGGCYYERKNGLTHVHIGVSGLTANTTTTVYTLPSDVRPSTRIASAGLGGTLPLTAAGQIQTSGVVQINSTGTYAMMDFWYF